MSFYFTAYIKHKANFCSLWLHWNYTRFMSAFLGAEFGPQSTLCRDHKWFLWPDPAVTEFKTLNAKLSWTPPISTSKCRVSCTSETIICTRSSRKEELSALGQLLKLHQEGLQATSGGKVPPGYTRPFHHCRSKTRLHILLGRCYFCWP